VLIYDKRDDDEVSKEWWSLNNGRGVREGSVYCTLIEARRRREGKGSQTRKK
jgi:hypothetical protein